MADNEEQPRENRLFRRTKGPRITIRNRVRNLYEDGTLFKYRLSLTTVSHPPYRFKIFTNGIVYVTFKEEQVSVSIFRTPLCMY